MDYKRGLTMLQKISMSIMAVLVLVTFVGANLHALLWQSSQWLVSTVLPSVVVNLTNEERADNNASPVVRNSILDNAAQMKANHMAQNGYFAHYSPDGVSPWYWFDQAGYVYAHAGENLAVHFTDSSDVVQAWMDSPTHRANIVNGLYTEIGIGTAKGKFQGYDTVFVVQLFGTPAVAPITQEVITNAVESQIAIETNETVQTLDGIRNQLAELAQEVVNEESVSTTLDRVVLSESEPQNETPLEENIEVAEVIYDDKLPEEDVVVIESPTISTSSGLAIAQIDRPNTPTHAGFTVASVATQPNTLLQMIYAVLSLVVISLLGISIVMETRRYHFQQVAYGVLLLFAMGGLLFIHQFLTTGAVVV